MKNTNCTVTPIFKLQTTTWYTVDALHTFIYTGNHQIDFVLWMFSEQTKQNFSQDRLFWVYLPDGYLEYIFRTWNTKTDLFPFCMQKSLKFNNKDTHTHLHFFKIYTITSKVTIDILINFKMFDYNWRNLIFCWIIFGRYKKIISENFQ